MHVRCEVRFFVRLYKIDAGILAYVKEILCKIKENLQADDVQSFQAVFVRCCLNLKKKIAFIASVTMIATTAAYLPAEVAQNIGIGSGIVASADYSASESINQFSAYIKINGNYVLVNGDGTTTSYRSLSAAKSAGVDTGSLE